MKPTILINLSGGLDSTYVAYHTLKNMYPRKVLLYHIHLVNAEKRSQSELKAVGGILNYFDKIGLKNYEYIHSAFNYGSLNKVTLKDIQIIATFNAALLKNPLYNNIIEIPLCWHKGEVNSDINNRGFRVKKVFESLEVPYNRVKLTFPIENLTRKEMIDGLPIELVSKISSCRKRDINNKPCHVCKTCKEYIEEGLYPL